MSRRGENIYKRKDGRYEGRYVIGKKADGRTKFGYIYGRKYTEVRSRLAKQKAMQEQRKSDAGGCAMLFEAWAEYWMHYMVRPNVKESTWQKYTGIMQRHLMPQFQGFLLGEITEDAVQELIRHLREKQLADATIQGILRLLHMALQSAMREGKLQKQPKIVYHCPQQTRAECVVLNLAEQKVLRSAGRDDDLPALIALYTGMRLGEVCALEWGDIDWENHTVTVRRTVQRLGCSGSAARADAGASAILGADFGFGERSGSKAVACATSSSGKKTALVVGSPKTDSSFRIIPLPDFIFQRLLQKKEGGQSCRYIFGTEQSCADPRTIQRRFKRLLADLGMREIHFHALRHTFATRLLELGVDVKTVSALLGHSSTRTTLDVYAHSLMDSRRSAVEKLEQAV